jgi:hypothetical protein
MALDVDRREDIDPAIVLDYQPDPPKKVEPVEMQSFRAIEREVTG